MKKILVIMAAFVLLASCEKQVDIDVDAQQPKVVVYAAGEADSTMHLRLTYSRPVFGTFYVADGESYFEEIDNATVTLAVNGGIYNATNTGGDYTLGYAPHSGDRLSLTVKVPGKKDVTAEAIVPQAPVVTDMSFSYDGQAGYNTPGNSVLRFKLVDSQASEDYYAVSVLRTDTVHYTWYDDNGNVEGRDTSISQYNVYFECVDYMVIHNAGVDAIDPEDAGAANAYYGETLLFSDANINGMSHEFVLKGFGEDRYYDVDYPAEPGYGADVDIETSVSYRLVVTALSRDMYLYLQSVDAYTDGEILGLFGEPVQIHSNVDGGIGIFGVNTKSVCPFYYRNDAK